MKQPNDLDKIIEGQKTIIEGQNKIVEIMSSVLEALGQLAIGARGQAEALREMAEHTYKARGE